ncbi:hypothetical protein EG329_008072 [Mollisiaceae sp. DMI_Dod_QoI]|nr:hypothetical protein EG329_008072 [Helotiales sp. DMI_Dod_QoI]
MYQKAGYEAPLSLPPDPKLQVSMNISRNSIDVSIPMLIGYDESKRDKSSQGYEFGEHNIKLYISAEYNDPLAVFFHMRPLSEDSSSEGCFDNGSRWLRKCLETHDKCPKQISPLPNRVVDVGSDTRDPFLYVSKREYGSWLALSHCWGLKPILRTTLDTLGPFTQSIPINELPQTFKDAIQITRKLGYQYIWIDSLCIIQDSREDWEAESKMMAMIYQNATASISADASTGDHEGIFNGVKRQRHTFKHTALPCGSQKRGLSGIIFISIPQGKHHFKVMPLQSRAWVLQEKTLSVRMLHYQYTGLDWQCQTLTWTEIQPSLMKEQNKSIHTIAQKSLHPCIDFDSRPNSRNSEFHTLQWWYFQIIDYTTRQITYTKDRFPAIAALAKEFANRTGYHYKAGIWEEDFKRGLLWKGTVPKSYYGLGPSWSWVGVVGNQWSGNVYDIDSLKRHRKKFAAELVGFSEPTAADEYLAGGAATILTLRGWCIGAQDFVAGKSFYPHCPFFPQMPVTGRANGDQHGTAFPILKDSPDSKLGEEVVFYPDDDFDPSPVVPVILSEKAVIICISEFEAWDTYLPHTFAIWALMIEPTNRVDGSFRRIGLVKIPSIELIAFDEGFDLRTIRLS